MPTKVLQFGKTIWSLFWSWVLAVWLISFMELGWDGGPSEIFAHARQDRHLALAAAIAVFIGWLNARPPPPNASDEWAFRHPLATQAMVGLTIAAMMLAAYFLQSV